VIALIVYGTVVALLVLAGARAAESLARGAGKPVRWIWLGAMLATLGLSFTGASRATRGDIAIPAALVRTASSGTQHAVTTPASLRDRIVAMARAAQQPLNGALARVTAPIERVVPSTVVDSIIAVWVLLGIVLLATFFTVQRRQRRARRVWPLADVAGARVGV
jgi:hypothetical protein